MAERNVRILKPQPGPQTDFLSTDADICIYGGSAGGGKSFALLLDPLRHKDNPFFRGIFFRKNSTQIRNPGGLWDEAGQIYPILGGVPKEKELIYRFDSGMLLKFSHLEYEKDMYSHQGGQYTAIYFDELTHFSEAQFEYLMSRNRSKAGIPGYIRASCNPDCDSWVREWVDWYIDPDTGYAIPERSGVLRYFVKLDGERFWGNSKEELIEKYGKSELPHDHPEQIKPRSFTFIRSSVHDNQELLKVDPNYIGNLESLGTVQRERLLMGNWNIKPSNGVYWNRDFVEIIDRIPLNVKWVRGYDKAATEPSETNRNPDFTAHVKMGITPEGKIIIAHAGKYQLSIGKVYQEMLKQAEIDGIGTRIVIPRDPGAAGKEAAENNAKVLNRYNVRARPITKDKVTYFLPFAAACENGLVQVVRGSWNEAYFRELENFDGLGKAKDDWVDASSISYNEITGHLNTLSDFVMPKLGKLNPWSGNGR